MNLYNLYRLPILHYFFFLGKGGGVGGNDKHASLYCTHRYEAQLNETTFHDQPQVSYLYLYNTYSVRLSQLAGLHFQPFSKTVRGGKLRKSCIPRDFCLELLQI